HAPALAVIVQILEQLLSGQLHAATHESRKAAITQGDLVLNATFAAKVDVDVSTANIHVAGTQGRQPVGAVAARITRVADADQRGFEQHHHQGHDLFARHAGKRQMLFQTGAQPWQGLAELEHALILVAVPDFSPAEVVAILLAPARITPGCLQVALRIRTDPYICIRWRNRQLVDSLDYLRIADTLTIGHKVDKLAA